MALLSSAITLLIMKPILVFPAPSALETPKSVFKKPANGGLLKTDFYNQNCYIMQG